MEKQTRKTTQTIEGNYPSLVDLAVAREDFAKNVKLFEEKNSTNLKEVMGEKDPFYLSAKGYFELRNVLAGKASLGPTVRALNLLKALATPPALSKRLARQGLAKTLSIAPLALVSCLGPTEATPVETIIFSGIIIAVIVTVAALWWADYKAGTFNRRSR